MFQFPTFAYLIGMTICDSRVAPFGNLRVKGRLHLPTAYRS